MLFDIKKFAQSGKMKIVVSTIIIIAIISGIFQAGVFVGFHKASFLFKNGDNFYKAFGNKDDRLMNGMGMGNGIFRDELSGGHGVIGKIIKINLPRIVVIGPDNIEKTVLIDKNTNIHKSRDILSPEELLVDQFITVLGGPNDSGEIVAKFIRAVPPQPQEAINNSSTTNLK